MRYFQPFAIAVICGIATITVIGCASQPERKLEFPSGTLKQSGDGVENFTAPENGTVSIVDTSDNSIVYSGNVATGDMIKVDPDQNQILLNTMAVSSNRLHKGNTHAIYFVPKSADTHSPM